MAACSRAFEGFVDGRYYCLKRPGTGGSWTDASDWLHELDSKWVRVTIEVLEAQSSHTDPKEPGKQHE